MPSAQISKLGHRNEQSNSYTTNKEITWHRSGHSGPTGQASPSFFGGGPINEEQKSALSICRRHRQGVAHLWVNVNVLCKSVISCVFCFTNLHTATSYQSLRRRQYFVSSSRLLGHDLIFVAPYATTILFRKEFAHPEQLAREWQGRVDKGRFELKMRTDV